MIVNCQLLRLKVVLLTVVFLVRYERTYSQTVLHCYEWKGRPDVTDVYYGIQRLSLSSDNRFKLDVDSFRTKRDKKMNRMDEPFILSGEWKINTDTLRLISKNTQGEITRASIYKITKKAIYDVTYLTKDRQVNRGDRRYYNRLKRKMRLKKCS